GTGGGGKEKGWVKAAVLARAKGERGAAQEEGAGPPRRVGRWREIEYRRRAYRAGLSGHGDGEGPANRGGGRTDDDRRDLVGGGLDGALHRREREVLAGQQAARGRRTGEHAPGMGLRDVGVRVGPR